MVYNKTMRQEDKLMSLISIERNKNLIQITFNNGVTNPISQQLVANFEAILPELESPECQGVVICGGEKFFSMGLNLPELLQLDRNDMTTFFTKFDSVCYRIFSLNKPTMSVLEGHAVAGGAVLALMTDYRFASEAEKQFGLNEIKIGVPVPYLTSLVVHAITSPKHAKEMLYTGEFVPFSKGYEIGIIDKTVPSEELYEEAQEKISQLAQHNSSTFIAMKNNQIEKIQELYLKNKDVKNQEFIDCWFEPQVRELLTEASKRF